MSQRDRDWAWGLLFVLVITAIIIAHRKGWAFTPSLPLPAAAMSRSTDADGIDGLALANGVKTVMATPTPKELYLNDIMQIVLDSNDCRNVVHGSPEEIRKRLDRGKAPIGYLKGMGLTFAKSVCKAEPVRPLGPTNRDALALYGVAPTLANTYTLMLGHGMRESSGKFYEGRDESPSARYTNAVEVEAGLFQPSLNSKHWLDINGIAMPKPTTCFMPVWKEGLKKPDTVTKNWGSGPGLQFQKDMKACPAYAAEYNALVIRVGMHHYGPLKRKEALFAKSCLAMFERIEAAVKSSPEVCKKGLL